MRNFLKHMLGSRGILGATLRWRAGLFSAPQKFSSAHYWEMRYRSGGNSGAGSYNRLAQFKAEVLNEFVASRQVSSVIEFGCGDGAQLVLAQYPRYTGVDVSPHAVALCRRIHGDDPSKQFFTSDSLAAGITADLALSLDVVYHLIEDPVFDAYMRLLFASAERFCIVYSSNEDKTWGAEHVRHRKFTDWVERNEPRWTLIDVKKNRYPYDPNDETQTSFADFHIFQASP